MIVLEIILWLAVAAVLVPFGVLLVECLAALLPGRAPPLAATTSRPRCAVLVPAHDEEGGIKATLASILPQLEPSDRVIVVADNCTDRTAEVARAAGATVIERQDATRRGKGYALDFGVRHLESDPPEVVVFLDADCALGPGTMDHLVRGAIVSGAPLQAVYLMTPPAGSTGTKERLSAFAFQFKNLVRPLGLHRLGLPCLLTGAGMAFPWATAQAADLATGNIVEDMKLGLDLAVGGQPPRLCPAALVTSELPSGDKAAKTQRSRWEHGHVQTITKQAPRLFGAGLRQGRLDLLGLALELSVPPLSMLFLLWSAAAAAAFGWWLATDALAPLLTLLAVLAAFGLTLFACWAKFGRQQLPLLALLSAPIYILWKVPIYLALVFKPQRAWVRTERTTPKESEPPPS